ncbi:MAG: hypothetical protein RMK64_04205 [Rhodovarius sp.]|nr:hypothetical protein [Rhodovarius sp.]
MAILIYAASGGLTADLEESCARAGIAVAALILNRDLPPRGLGTAPVWPAHAFPDALRDSPFLCPLFTPANRRAAVEEALALGLRPAPPLLDPTGDIARSCSFGAGCYVNAGCILGSAGRYGRFVLVNRGANLGHHALVEDFASVGPGVTIAGDVRIGAAAMIGAGAVLGPGIAVGARAVIAPGAVVLRDVPAGQLAIGNPARILPPTAREVA